MNMADDPWSALKRYAEQQRQAQLAHSQQIAEEQAHKKKATEEHLRLREHSRLEATQRQVEAASLTSQQSSDKRRSAQEAHAAYLARSAEELRKVNAQHAEAQRRVAQKLAEEQAIKEKGSPIEAAFYEAWCNRCPSIELKRQYPIGVYRVDFAHPETLTAIELDGHAFHSGRRDRTRDYQRQRWIEDHGWFFVRFTGSEVFSDVEDCVHTLWKRIQARMAR